MEVESFGKIGRAVREFFSFEIYNVDATLKQTLSFDFAWTILGWSHENRESSDMH